ncbi:hypothetical protein [Streptomyces hirsutus]
MRTAGPGGRYRPRRLGLSLLLLVPLLGMTGASGQDGAESATRAAAADTTDTRIAYAGTRHRSLGQVATKTSSTPLFGAGPAHHDVQPSALGDQMVFASLRDEETPQIYLRSADGSVRRLTSGMDAANPRLTPDGTSVVFDAARSGGPGGGTQRDLWLVHTDGTGLTRLTDTPGERGGPDRLPRRAAVGVRERQRRTGRGEQIYVRPLNGGTATRVTSPANGTAGEPVWNPVNHDENRDWIAYTATTTVDGQSVPRLRVTNAAGTGDEPLLGGARAQWRAHGAAWLPDGDDVLFLSPENTCECEGDWDHVFQATAHVDEVPSLVLNENREVSSVTWSGSLDGGGAVVERTSAAGPHVVTLQDARADGSDPRDLGLTILDEDPAADTDAHQIPPRTRCSSPGPRTTRGPSGRTTRPTAAGSC